MYKVGRNDPCPCGSGIKYKKCCLLHEGDKLSRWNAGIDKVLLDYPNYQIAAPCLKEMLFLIDTKWQGACHASCSVLYVLLRELGIPVNIYSGEVHYDSRPFDHTWLEINGEIIDLAIAHGLNGERTSAPIIMGINVETLRSTTGKYGIRYGTGLDADALLSVDQPFTLYMDSFPVYKEGLWRIVLDIASKLNLNLDLSEIRIKYADTKHIIRRDLE